MLFRSVSQSRYVVEQTVLVEISHNVYKKDVIKEIIYEEFESVFFPAKKLSTHYGYFQSLFNEEEIASGNFMEVRKYKPYYKLESGKVVKWEHELAGFVEEK